MGILIMNEVALPLKMYFAEILWQTGYSITKWIFLLYCLIILIHWMRPFFIHTLEHQRLQSSKELAWAIYLLIRDTLVNITVLLSFICLFPGYFGLWKSMLSPFGRAGGRMLILCLVLRLFGNLEEKGFIYKLYHAFLFTGFGLFSISYFYHYLPLGFL